MNSGARSLEGDASPADIADTITGAALTAQPVIDCVLFAINQRRDCFIRSLHFEQLVPPRT